MIKNFMSSIKTQRDLHKKGKFLNKMKKGFPQKKDKKWDEIKKTRKDKV